MGQAIENAALSRDHEIVARISQTSPLEWERLKEADVAIEFSAPHAAIENIRRCFDADVPVVVGTTGWYEDYDAIKEEAINNKKGILTATNFSLGVNIFFQINKRLAELMENHESYDVKISEIHHTQKLDAPSGTAISLAGQIIDRLRRKFSWKLKEDSDEDTVNSTLYIESHRIDEVPGTHVITYDSAIDQIQITHTAHSRSGFAFGAVLAAEWLNGKNGVYTMEDIINQ